MKTDIDEIADLLARVKDFCARVGKEPLGIHDTLGRPVDDKILLVVPTMIGLCDMIPGELHFAAALPVTIPEHGRMVAESAQRVEWMLGNLRSLLYQAKASKDAFELARDIGRIRADQRARAKIANDAKRADAESRTRQIAGLWNAATKEHPAWNADTIGQEVAAKVRIKQRALESHVAEARRQGLIPPRHRRQK